MLSQQELYQLMRTAERLYSCRFCIIDGFGNFMFSSNFPEIDTTHLAKPCNEAKKSGEQLCRDCDDISSGQHANLVRSAFWRVCPFGIMEIVGTVLPPEGKRFQIFAGPFQPRTDLPDTALIFPQRHVLTLGGALRALSDLEFEELPIFMDMLTREMTVFFENKIQERKNPPDPRKIVENCINGMFRSDVSLSYIAGKLGWSDSHATVRIRQMFGKSFVQLLNERRIENAKWLLRNQFYQPVASVAKVSGFRCTSYFHRIFQQTVGMTPNEYRKKSRAQAPSPQS